MNKKTKKVALFSALTAKFDAGEIIVVDDIKLDDYRTAAIAEMLEDLGCEKEITVTYKDAETKKIFDETHQRTCKKRTTTVPQKALIVLPEVNPYVVKSCANIPYAVATLSTNINVYEVLNAEKVILTRAAVEKLEEVYA